MSVLEIKDKAQCRWDAVSLGEVMLRLDPGEARVHTARNFQVWEGGGEYNVARGLKRCFGLDATVVTAFADNAVRYQATLQFLSSKFRSLMTAITGE